jgi:hypothetical protein
MSTSMPVSPEARKETSREKGIKKLLVLLS